MRSYSCSCLLSFIHYEKSILFSDKIIITSSSTTGYNPEISETVHGKPLHPMTADFFIKRVGGEIFCGSPPVSAAAHRNLHLRGSVCGESIKNVTHEIGCVNPRNGLEIDAIHLQHFVRGVAPILQKVDKYNLNEDAPPFVWTGQIFGKHLRD